VVGIARRSARATREIAAGLDAQSNLFSE